MTSPLVSKGADASPSFGRSGGPPDCYRCLHSASATWSTAASQAEVAADLARVLKATHSDPAEKLQWSMALTKQTSTELWSERKTEKAGFVDLQTFSLTANSSGTGTTIVATSRSRDYNMWTSCSCLKNECGRWIACFLCCCGICPTKDWGANKELLTVVREKMSSTVTEQPKA